MQATVLIDGLDEVSSTEGNIENVMVRPRDLVNVVVKPIPPAISKG